MESHHHPHFQRWQGTPLSKPFVDFYSMNQLAPQHSLLHLGVSSWGLPLCICFQTFIMLLLWPSVLVFMSLHFLKIVFPSPSGSWKGTEANTCAHSAICHLSLSPKPIVLSIWHVVLSGSMQLVLAIWTAHSDEQVKIKGESSVNAGLYSFQGLIEYTCIGYRF